MANDPPFIGPFVSGRPCRTERNGRPFDAWCDECPHVLVVHRRDLTCELCELCAALVALREMADG